MKPAAIGALLGALLAWAALSFGIGGFLLMALFMVVGSLVALALEGRVDLRALRDALTGRRSSS